MNIRYHPHPEDRRKAIRQAQGYISRNPLFLDAETTGLSNMHEICEIAIVDVAGEVLINSLVKPTRPIDFNTSQIHGITDEMVQTAPTFRDLLPTLDRLLDGRSVLVYNVEFDQDKICRSLEANGIAVARHSAGNAEGIQAFRPWWYAPEDWPMGTLYDPGWYDAMELYAAYYGDWNNYHGNYRWQRLGTALLQCGIDQPDGIHRALADAEMTRRLMLHLAEQKEEDQQPALFNEENKENEQPG